MSSFGDGIATDERELFRLFGKLHLTLGNIDRRLERREALDKRALYAESPRFIRAHGTATCPASGFMVIPFDLGGPRQGWHWHVRVLAIGGLTVDTVAAGTANVFAGGSDMQQISSISQISLLQWRSNTATTLPLLATFGQGECLVSNPEQLFICISGGTSGQQYVAAATVEQVQDSATQQTASV